MIDFYVNGRPASSTTSAAVLNKRTGQVLSSIAVPTAVDVERALAGAHAAAQPLASAGAHTRRAALSTISAGLKDRFDEFADVIGLENGKPAAWARAEVHRAIGVFDLAAEETTRQTGTMHALDDTPEGAGRVAVIRRVPRGPVLAITPFNFPLNLVAHKVAPALAAGAPVVIKPAPATPLSALLLGEVMTQCHLPEGSWSVLPVGNEQMDALVTDPRLPVISFTGSGPVGWSIKARVPRKHVTLELGGDAAAVICSDWSSEEDLAQAARRIALFGNYQGGQACVAVQRVLVHASLADRFEALLAHAVRTLPSGPDPDSVVGPLISSQAADGVMEMIDDATAKGARLICGGNREGTTVEPTLLAELPPNARLAREEVFGPVLSLEVVQDIEEAFQKVNASRFGLQTGIFSRDVRTIFRAFETLEVGGVIAGDVPTYRHDALPYGGVKESGVGKEGVRAAIEDLTQERVLVMSGLEA